MAFASRAGEKLDHALSTFRIDVAARVCADFGSNAGGFVDCLLQRGASKVYSIDTGYGVLDWKLRNDPRVVVMERTNAIHATLPERVTLVSIDVAWTRQRIILPAAVRVGTPDVQILTLIKPQYEAERHMLRDGVLPDQLLDEVLKGVKGDIDALGLRIRGVIPSPIKGAGGNAEYLAWLQPVTA
jgi:23S rRNA (cytidine1920-2'-O)/16S rRNA (cytidine1409-2'-O)-methyltransferase